MADIDQIYAEAEQLKRAGDVEGAIAKLEEGLQVDPRHVLSHLALAVLYGRVNQHEDAIRHGEMACQIDPQDAFNFTAMSVTYQRAWAGTHNQQYIQLAENAMARARMLEGR
ncbi:MAG: scaffolding protein [Pirellulales bacterium]